MTNEEQHSSESVSTDLLGSTLNNRKDSAYICRERGWVVGTRLIADDGSVTSVIEITAVGEYSILAKLISENGKEVASREGLWTLSFRDWRVLQKSHSEES